jgi:hypothetical protein
MASPFVSQAKGKQAHRLEDQQHVDAPEESAYCRDVKAGHHHRGKNHDRAAHLVDRVALQLAAGLVPRPEWSW